MIKIKKRFQTMLKTLLDDISKGHDLWHASHLLYFESKSQLSEL